MRRTAQVLALALVGFGILLRPNAIVAANNNVMDAPSAGDLLIIPATYEEKSAARRTAAVSSRKPAARGRATSARVPTHTAAYSKPVPAKVLHKKATVKTAGLTN